MNYKERSPLALDFAGNYYFKHVGAMTRENLYSKADIAEELAVRDAQIDHLCKQLAYHTNCSLEEIKQSLPQYLLGED